MIYSTPVIKKDQPDDSYKFQPLPTPKGEYPYHLNINNIHPQHNPNHMCFHMMGDTGGEGKPEIRKSIIDQIITQSENDSFIYHLGDLVYHHGEAGCYATQFFQPFERYPGPIFAIAGNHDGDVNPASTIPYHSLDAFNAVFCDRASRHVAFSGISNRKSMTQPHVYFTLETTLATIIGLYSNVTKFGIIDTEQVNWFRNELQTAPRHKMLIVCLHHAPYSADVNHGSSLTMINMLESSFEATGITPDVVFSGHVHNYQRFEKEYANGCKVPYIVSGAGGFEDLHSIAHLNDERFAKAPVNHVVLKHYQDTLHGFLKITIERNSNLLTLNGNYYTLSDSACFLNDSFSICKSFR